MSDFGDFDDDDALDTEPPDPEQVAIRFHKYRKDADSLERSWDELTDAEKLITIEVFIRLFAWLRRQGAFQ